MSKDNNTISPPIIQGIRGEQFKTFLYNILNHTGINTKYINALLDDKGMEMFDMAFTHPTGNNEVNYEYLEFLGDASINKAIGWYLSVRFPQLKCPQGIKILTRLKHNLRSKKSFSEFGKILGFWDYVTANEDIKSKNMNSTLEDVFEAFCGAVEMLLEERVKVGYGYLAIYNLVKYLLDGMEISLKYSDLFDSKTRLKELFDYFKEDLGLLKYNSERVETNDSKSIEDNPKKQYIFNVEAIIQTTKNSSEVIGIGSHYIKVKAEQVAADIAIKNLNKRGYIKPLPDTYKIFCLE